MTPLDRDAVARVIDDVWAERVAQHNRWGVQDLPDGTKADEENMAAASLAKQLCDATIKAGTVTYADLLVEEVTEAACCEDPALLRKELIQVAAVAVQWVEKLDRAAKAGK